MTKVTEIIRDQITVLIEGRDSLADIIRFYDEADLSDVVEEDRAFVTALSDAIDYLKDVL